MKKILGIAFAVLIIFSFASCDQIMNIFLPKVNVSIIQPTGGNITASPQKTQYTQGESVTFTATPSTGYTFVNWTGGLAGNTTSSATLVVNTDTIISAIFIPSTVATPTFYPEAGTYNSAINVYISCTTADTLIYYTTDGSTPTTSSTRYTAAVDVSSSKTIKAIATKTGMSNSAVGSAAYTINVQTPVATPTMDPAGGYYTSAQNVAITTTTSGASIYYTLDGTTPTSSSTLYTGQINISSTKTLKAIGVLSGYLNSAVASQTYYISTTSTGTIVGSVKDANTNSGVSGVTAKVNSSTGSLVTSTTTASDGSYTLSVAPGTGYTVVFEKSGYHSANYYNVSVTASVTTYLATLLQIASTYTTTGTISGTVLNAATAVGLSGASLSLRAGWNNTSTTTTALYTASSGVSGQYYFYSIPSGYYTMQVSLSGYTTAFVNVISIGGLTRANQNANLTPILASQQLRFVLKWGSTPSDLDSHMKVPTSTPYHIYYPYDNKGSQLSSPYALLDVDDTSSYGPETITIYTQLSGTYTYYVHDFSNAYSTTSTALGNSGAYVEVYYGGTMLAKYYVPVQAGTLWKVCSWNGTTLTPINLMLWESSASNVHNRATKPGKENAPEIELP